VLTVGAAGREAEITEKKGDERLKEAGIKEKAARGRRRNSGEGWEWRWRRREGRRREGNTEQEERRKLWRRRREGNAVRRLLERSKNCEDRRKRHREAWEASKGRERQGKEWRGRKRQDD
jgi:hypothetical protein